MIVAVALADSLSLTTGSSGWCPRWSRSRSGAGEDRSPRPSGEEVGVGAVIVAFGARTCAGDPASFVSPISHRVHRRDRAREPDRARSTRCSLPGCGQRGTSGSIPCCRRSRSAYVLIAVAFAAAVDRARDRAWQSGAGDPPLRHRGAGRSPWRPSASARHGWAGKALAIAAPGPHARGSRSAAAPDARAASARRIALLAVARREACCGRTRSPTAT